MIWCLLKQKSLSNQMVKRKLWKEKSMSYSLFDVCMRVVLNKTTLFLGLVWECSDFVGLVKGWCGVVVGLDLGWCGLGVGRRWTLLIKSVTRNGERKKNNNTIAWTKPSKKKKGVSLLFSYLTWLDFNFFLRSVTIIENKFMCYYMSWMQKMSAAL